MAVNKTKQAINASFPLKTQQFSVCSICIKYDQSTYEEPEIKIWSQHCQVKVQLECSTDYVTIIVLKIALVILWILNTHTQVKQILILRRNET